MPRLHVCSAAFWYLLNGYLSGFIRNMPWHNKSCLESRFMFVGRFAKFTRSQTVLISFLLNLKYAQFLWLIFFLFHLNKAKKQWLCSVEVFCVNHTAASILQFVAWSGSNNPPHWRERRNGLPAFYFIRLRSGWLCLWGILIGVICLVRVWATRCTVNSAKLIINDGN